MVSRWLHIYLSMASFAVVLFFSATGLTLNHADRWSGHDRVTRYSGVLPATVVRPGQAPDDLAVAEYLRLNHHLRGTVTDARDEADQTTLSFKGAGYTADAFVERPSGRYQVIETRSGAVATLNDLHRGVVTGRAWSWVIDVSAILLVLVSLTGLLLLLFVYKRRASGLVLAGIAGGLVLLIARSFAM